MPDAAGQSGGELELHLESLLGEIEATQHEVEARSPRSDEPSTDPIAEPADRDDEARSAEDQTLDVLSEVEADLGELMDAISDLGDASIQHEPLVETREDEPEDVDTAPDSRHDNPATETAPELAQTPDQTPDPAGHAQAQQSGFDGEAGSEADDIAGDLEGLLGDEPEESVSNAPSDESEANVESGEPDEAPFNALPEDAPTAGAAPGAGDHESGDSLDDMLAAASEELLADEATDPAPIDDPEPAQPADHDEPVAEDDTDAGTELLDAVDALGDSAEPGAPEPAEHDHHDSDEAVAGVVEIPGVHTIPDADAPESEEQPTDAAAQDEPAPAPEPVSTTVEEIPPKPETTPPTGRLAPLIIAWRATKRTLTPVAKATAKHAGPALADAALAVSKPLREKPKSVRDTVGWIALYTAFLAVCLWVFALGFRSPDPKAVGDSGVRIVNPDATAAAPVP